MYEELEEYYRELKKYENLLEKLTGGILEGAGGR
jgi:hypothetical protein